MKTRYYSYEHIYTSKPDMVGFKVMMFFLLGDSLFLDILSSFFNNVLQLFDNVLNAWVI